MEKQIYRHNLKIASYDIKGKGKPVILIHGFLETSERGLILPTVYPIIFLLFRLIAGHGKSELYNAPFTMCKYAESVYSVLNAEDINNAFIVGPFHGWLCSFGVCGKLSGTAFGFVFVSFVAFCRQRRKEKVKNANC